MLDGDARAELREEPVGEVRSAHLRYAALVVGDVAGKYWAASSVPSRRMGKTILPDLRRLSGWAGCVTTSRATAAFLRGSSNATVLVKRPTSRAG